MRSSRSQGKSLKTSALHPHSDLHLQFIEWAKQHGHSPATGAATFIGLQQDLCGWAEKLGLTSDPEVREALCSELRALGEETDVAVQFPPIYCYSAQRGCDFRYSLMLVLAEDCVEWTARVWSGLDYLGMLTGSGRGARSSYNALARQAVERQLDLPEPAYAHG